MIRTITCLSLLFILSCSSRKPVVLETFGTSFEPTGVIPSDRLLSEYSEAQLVDTVTTTLKGVVNEVCQAKGCWLTLTAGPGEEIMVKFKDYAFFVPMDIGEREVMLHGKAYYQLTPVDELRHYARDAGKSEAEIAAIVSDKKELRFLADGVQLL